MANAVEKSCTMLVYNDKQASATEIKEALEGNDPLAKQAAMKKAVSLLLAGEQLPQLFITIVRYVLPSEDHTVQKLLLLYLEAIEKTDATGKLLPEMILICQNLRNNLQHPNEYIRGVTLRFLCRIKEEEILEPLVPSILANLEHRHSYVRRNAVLAINSIYKLPKGELLLADAPEMIERILRQEQDLSTRRNCLAMLTNNAVDRAIRYLLDSVDQLATWGDLLQLSALDLIRKACRSNPGEKGKFIKTILLLLQSPSPAVMYECAVTLTSLSSAPSAVRAAANCFCSLLSSHSDNNVKLIVLDRLQELKEKHREVMTDMVMDTLRALASPSLDIRKKTLDISLELITSRNIDEVVSVLKKEVVKTQNKEYDKAGEYRQMLVQAIHSCAVKFPEVAGNVVHVLMDFLGDANTASALDVIFFVREIMETNAKLRPNVLERLHTIFYQACGIRTSRVVSCALWIMGEYCSNTAEILAALSTLKDSLGSVPFLTDPAEGEEGAGAASNSTTAALVMGSKRPAVLADGTYATQSAVAEVSSGGGVTGSANAGGPNLRSLLLGGDFFLGGVIAGTFVKLLLRLSALREVPASQLNNLYAEAMQYVVATLRLGESAGSTPTPLDADSRDRMLLCLRVLAGQDTWSNAVWLGDCRSAFALLTTEKQKEATARNARDDARAAVQPDDLIDFQVLKNRKGLSQLEVEDEVTSDLARATGYAEAVAAASSRLNRVLQLTGLSDPVYAEAVVTVHQYDIVLDVTVTNRTTETMQALCLELATMGDLKLVERPQNYTLAPGDTKLIRANIKVSSTETGVIFGNIVYEGTGYSERSVVVLNDIHIDIMDYISPAYCADVQFRNMWAEFEWENKVAIATTFTDVAAFLQHIISTTNMKCLTPPSALEGDCGYLAANLYAKSVFGEDALVNVSVERTQPTVGAPGAAAGQDGGRLAGYIRIRSKTQGIALSLGDKITLMQKAPVTTAAA
ncbi:hypothetical protein VOLCADRAFT_67325 [Volvox carteri f. nagariensis]|uniref:Coatomer subunit beta n=1 Tax=Volvox carteri f. nagariensis TaxID=3068 RepID=D8UDJ4_VOLCA|nr:uncharacterized protein VOLCADRAFT_67325 [Volvox carteri f. nagariensis]EFJ42176.1 hypothetical protein VOLCADRAFT_67325 [Volvox carteri f. nagariensis]|eukprot:XP_002956719.1 hypothetical protein VOLCADRAFT_67325 [Volvox carteri f. nagariensis]